MSTDIAPSASGDKAVAEHDITQSFDVDVSTKDVTPPTGEQLAEQLDDVTGSLTGESPESSPKHEGKEGDRTPGSDAQPDAVEKLRQQAQQFGFASEDVQSLDATALRNLLDVQANLFRASQFPQQPMQPQFMPPPQQMPQPGYGQQPQHAPPSVQPFKFDLPKDVYDDKLVDQLNAAAERMAAHEQMLYQQQQVLAQQQAWAQQQAQQALVAQQVARDQADSRELDSWIDGLGASFQPVFGGKNVTENSPGFRARAAIFQQMRTLQQQYATAGIPAQPDAIKEQAARLVLGQQYDYFRQQEQRKPVQKRQEQFISRANGQAARKPTSGKSAAVDRLNEFRQQHNLD